MPSRARSRSLCWRSRSCQMSSVPGLLFSSRVGLDGEEGPEEKGPEEAGPNSTLRVDLPQGRRRWEGGERESELRCVAFEKTRQEQTDVYWLSDFICRYWCITVISISAYVFADMPQYENFRNGVDLVT